MYSGFLRTFVLLVTVLLLVTAGNVFAENRVGSLTVTPFISGHIFEGNENLKNSPEYGLSFGYNFTENWAAELTGSFYEMNEIGAGGQEFDAIGARIDTLYHFQPKEKVIPYFVFGIGAASLEKDTTPSESTNEDLTVNYGFGLKLFTTDWLALRLDIRHLFRFDISEGATKYNDKYWNNLLVTGGFAFQMGGIETKSPRVVDADDDGIVDSRDRCLDTPPGYNVDNSGCPIDSDSDGVVDAEDLCADTESGAEVDANGCAVVTEEAVIEDADGDGVADIDDKCPNTPVEIPVNSYGCPSDTDGDSVFDIDDDCPNTPAGSAVGPDGCGPDEVNIKARFEDDAAKADAFRSDHPEGSELAALAEKESLELGIKFGANRSTIAPEYASDMKKAAAFMKAHPGAKVVVEGHTDSTGSSSVNKKLSQKRADTVRWILVRDYGVKADQVVAKGFGESQPIADNKTQSGRAQNRRVLLKIQK